MLDLENLGFVKPRYDTRWHIIAGWSAQIGKNRVAALCEADELVEAKDAALTNIEPGDALCAQCAMLRKLAEAGYVEAIQA